MKKPALSFSLVSVVAVLAAAGPVHAVNRFFITNQTLTLGTNDNIVPVRADIDQDIYGFSVHVQYDASKVQVTAVQQGTAVSGVVPEYFEGTITNSPGRIVHGVVFDTSGPTITKKLSPGTGQEVLKLSVNVVAAAATTVVLDFVNVPGNPARLNVMTDSNGDSVAPAPTLVDGTLTLSSSGPGAPVITSIENNMGQAGKQFLVSGENFTAPGLSVTVCDVAATAVLLPDNQTLQVTAPACAILGWAPLVVTTDAGSDTEPNGFLYEEETGVQFIRGDSNNDDSVNISDAVATLNDLFSGIPSAAPCRDALDSNDDGAVNISDPINVLNVLFSGTGEIRPPYPEPGVDPTADSIPECE
jgi:hypothetical protein